MLRGLDLFTGYGGLTLALKEWIKPIAYVEMEEYCQKIIAYRMAEGSLPRATLLADVKNIEGKFGICDIIYGGFPCQDVSVAGLRKGLEGERSGLFFEIVRLTKEIEPPFVFLENVPGVRTKGLRQIVGAFTEMGYDCRWTCLSASSVGANHQRDRWFLLSYSNKNRPNQNISLQARDERKSDEFVWNSKMANTKSKRLERHDCKTGTSKITEPWSSSWWKIEPNVGRVVDGPSARLDFNRKYTSEELMKYFWRERLQMLGNGVVPLQARTAFKKLVGNESLQQVEKIAGDHA